MFLDDKPSLEKPFSLSLDEIDRLIDLAVAKRSEKFLIALAGLGTYDKTLGWYDPIIGKKDPGVETRIIDKALARRQTKATSAEPQYRTVYGLSGNPPTLNHFHFIRYLISESRLPVKVILNAQSPLKTAKEYAHQTLRLQMLEVMMADLNAEDRVKCELSRIEVDRVAPSRMVVTMSILNLLANDNETFRLVLGMDALPKFNGWYHWSELGQLCQIKFYQRQGEAIDNQLMVSALDALQQGAVHDVHMVFNDDNQRQAFLNACPTFAAKHASVASIPDISEGSATQIRNQYLQWGDASPEMLTQDLQKTLNLHPGVHQVIVENNCYGASKNLVCHKTPLLTRGSCCKS